MGKSKLTLLVHFCQLWAGHSYFTEFELDVILQNKILTFSIWQKIQEPCIGSGTSNFQWFCLEESVTGFPSYTLQRFNLFLSVTCFSDLCDKVKFAFSFKWLLFWLPFNCQEPYLELYQNCMVEFLAKIPNTF